METKCGLVCSSVRALPPGAGHSFRFTAKKASAGDETGRRALAFSRHPALAPFHNHDPRAAAVVRSATSKPLSAYYSV
jgi:hypothetical protein